MLAEEDGKNRCVNLFGGLGTHPVADDEEEEEEEEEDEKTSTIKRQRLNR